MSEFDEDQTTSQNGDVSAEAGERASLTQFVLSGLAIALIGSVALGVIEVLAAAILNARYVPDGHWPVKLIVATMGKAIVTHALLWCPLLVVLAAAYGLIVRRRWAGPPEAVLAGLFVVAAGLVVVPVDLDMAGHSRPSFVAAALAGVLVLALAVTLLIRLLSGRRGPAAVRRAMNASAGAAGVIAVVTGAVFFRSPQYDPAEYQLPTSPRTAAGSDSPNVLWIVWDTSRADHMSCHGSPAKTTPFLDEWAKKSIVFDRAMSNAIWTGPSHASMFTGLPLRSHGLDFGHIWLDDEFTTVAEKLASHGYVTASFGNNPWLWRHTNLTQGFRDVYALTYLRQMTRFSLVHLVQKLGIRPPLPWLDPDFGAAITNDMVGDWLERNAGKGAPVFLFVNYMEAHLPYSVPAEFRRLYLDPAQTKRSYQLRYLYGNIVNALDVRFNIDGADFLSSADREVLRRQYDSTLRYLDYRTQELIRAFNDRGLLDNTIVVITSDHGEYLDTHGIWGHGFLAYNDLAHVALLLHEPNRKRGVRVSSPVQLSDLYGTIIHAATGDAPDADESPVVSRDLFSVARSRAAGAIAVTEYNGPADEKRRRIKGRETPRLLHMSAPQVAIDDGRFKYLKSADGTCELYDIDNDPTEEHNVIDDFPQHAARLDLYLTRWLDAVPAYRPQGGKTRAIDPETLRALKNLGYIVGDETNDGE